MNTPLPPGLDLSKLPEPIRKKLQAQLDRLPPEMRKELAEHGSPILERAIERAKRNNTPPLIQNKGHYNGTVQPGDRMHLSGGIVVLILAAAAALYYLYALPG